MEQEFMIGKKQTKTYEYDYEDYEDGGKCAATIVQEILEDPEFTALKELVIGDWGNAWEDDCQAIIDGIVEHADQFSHIERLFIGDMNFESGDRKSTRLNSSHTEHNNRSRMPASA